MATLVSLRSRVKLYLTKNFVNMHSINDAGIDQAIDDAYKRVAFETDTLSAVYTLTTVANQISYDLDPGMMMVSRVYNDYDGTAGAVDYGDDLDEISPRLLDGVAEYGTPTEYWIEPAVTAVRAGKIYFHPVPSTAGQTIRVLALKYPETLSEDTIRTATDLPVIFDQAIVFGAVSQLGAIGPGLPNIRYYMSEHRRLIELTRQKFSVSSRNRNYATVYRETWE